jgi:hypothetical protein
MKAPLTIQTGKPVSECVSLLQSAATADTFVARFSADSGAIMCRVRGNKFRLWQKRSYANSFKPFFHGSFEPGVTGTKITGSFRMHPFVIAFMAVWFGMLFLIGGTIIVGGFHPAPSGRHPAPLIGILAPLLMMLFGVGLVSLGKWLGRSEKDAIAEFLQQTFSGPAKTTGASIVQPAQPEKSLSGAILFFAGMALLCLVGAVTGISSVHTGSVNGSPPQTIVTHFQSVAGRGISFAFGLLLAFLAYGTWKRLYVAWAMVFGLIFLSAANFAYNILSNPDALPPFKGAALVAFGFAIFAGASAAAGYWAFWWYKKKDLFTE